MARYSEKYFSDHELRKLKRELSGEPERKYKLVIVPKGKNVDSELNDELAGKDYRRGKDIAPKESMDVDFDDEEDGFEDEQSKDDYYKFERGFASAQEYKAAREDFDFKFELLCSGDGELRAMVNRVINKAVFGTYHYRKYFNLSDDDPLTKLPPEYLFRLTSLMTKFCDQLEEEQMNNLDLDMYVSAGGILKVLKRMGLIRKSDMVIRTKVVGVTYEGRQDIVRKCRPGDRLELIRNRNNEHDKNAVAVFFGDDQAGFLCRELAEKIAPLLDNEREFFCVVAETTGGEELSSGLRIDIRQKGGTGKPPAGLYDINAGSDYIDDLK